jgi:DNA-binding MarR family transcriptional regulator
MPNADGTPTTEFADELITAVDRLTSLTTQDLLRAGVTLAQGRALSALFDRGPQRITDLARSEHVSQPAMTSLVSSMERRGLVSRTPDARDGRAVMVALTPAGQRVIAPLRAARVAAIREHLERLPAGDVERLAEFVPALDRLVERMRFRH